MLLLLVVVVPGGWACVNWLRELPEMRADSILLVPVIPGVPGKRASVFSEDLK